MNEKFFDLKKEKQDRMINAALKVFALNGYRHASTDDIVREAAISKGLLFHYFENKLGVYAFVYDYSVRYLLLELSTAVDAKETDLFTLMQQVETGKMHAMCGYPYLQPFLNRAQAENVNEALVAVEERKQQMETLIKQRIIQHQIMQTQTPPTQKHPAASPSPAPRFLQTARLSM